MKTIIKLALTIVVLFSCYTAIRLLQEMAIQPRISSVHPTSSDTYFIYKTSDVPVYKGSGTASTSSHQSNKSTAMPAVSPWSSTALPFTGKSSINNSTAQVSMYENIGALVPSINFKQSSSSQTAMNYSDNGVYSAVRRSSSSAGGSAGYGLAGSLSKPNGFIVPLYAAPDDPTDPDNETSTTPPHPLDDDAPVPGGIGVLLALAAGYWLMKKRKVLSFEL